MIDPLGRASARRSKELFWTLALGFVLGGLMTELVVGLFPESGPTSFLATSAAMSVSPFTIDVAGIALSVGFGLEVNVLTLVGIGVVGIALRSWL